MVYAMLVCRSLTYAQRTAAVLERSGISSFVQRTPGTFAPTGCSYSVKLPYGRLEAALERLRGEELPPKTILRVGEDGSIEEVAL